MATNVGLPMLALCATFCVIIVYPLDLVAAGNGERERHRKAKRARDREREREKDRERERGRGKGSSGRDNSASKATGDFSSSQGKAEEDELELAALTFEGELKRRGSFGQLEFLSSSRAPGGSGRTQGSKNTLLIKRKEGSVATLVVHSPR